MYQLSEETRQVRWQTDRERMVRVIEERGVTAPRVITAMLRVPRECFVVEDDRDIAYGDYPLPIGHGQTISQPFIVAYMIEALRLKGGEKVLEVGVGSGYAAAVLAEIGTRVYATERIEELAQMARENLEATGYDNVHIKSGQDSLGWPREAPFDAILVSAGATQLPPELVDQLAIGGVMVIPIGPDSGQQELVRVVRTGPHDIHRDSLGGVRFVPLIERDTFAV